MKYIMAIYKKDSSFYRKMINLIWLSSKNTIHKNKYLLYVCNNPIRLSRQGECMAWGKRILSGFSVSISVK